jgi:hypothetical protein
MNASTAPLIRTPPTIAKYWLREARLTSPPICAEPCA